MHPRLAIVAALAMSLAAPAPGLAAPTGVQWTPDANQLLVNKDVGNERWAITLNLADFSATGNVFFSDGGAPAFVWCEKTGDSFDADAGELNLRYRCFGADAGLGGFASADWSLINDDVTLPLSFFIPATETCDLTDALNGQSSGAASNYWNCGGSAGSFTFSIFANGTARNSATSTFEYDAVDEACRIAQLADGSYLDLEYSPSRDHLTLYEATTDVKRLIVSECERVDF
ncbi:MAG: hypothetical protein IT293_16735 [Deltaproteobacteria bacterium]|nr:hypothetical protein [Deltaproteobacteria bacterium]